MLKAKGIGVMNAGPFSARLLTDAVLPAWLKEPEEVKAAARQAAELCRSRGSSIAKLAVQFAIANPDIATTVAGSATYPFEFAASPAGVQAPTTTLGGNLTLLAPPQLPVGTYNGTITLTLMSR
jgi:hypothetical protein